MSTSMTIESEEFQKRLEQAKKDNWRIKSIVENADGGFKNLSEHQQELILQYMGLQKETIILEI